MKVTLSKLAGFCPGVKRADAHAAELIKSGGEKIYTLGHLIHNRLYNEELERQGVHAVDISELIDRGKRVLFTLGIAEYTDSFGMIFIAVEQKHRRVVGIIICNIVYSLDVGAGHIRNGEIFVFRLK